MAWIEVHQSLVSHKKTLALCDALAIEPAHAVGHLVCLWTWSIDNAPHGDLTEISAGNIARAAGFSPKRAQNFLDALIRSGFLEVVEKRLYIHDFEDYLGKLILRREQNAQRMRNARAVHVSSTRGQHESNTSPARAPATVPYPTQPDTTVPDTSPLPPSEPSEGGRGLETTTARCCTKAAVTNGEQHLATCPSNHD